MAAPSQEAVSAPNSHPSEGARTAQRKKLRVWSPLEAERPLRPLSKVCQLSVHRTHELFAANEGLRAPPFGPALEVYLRLKINDEYDFRNRFPLLSDPAALQRREGETQLQQLKQSAHGEDPTAASPALTDGQPPSPAGSAVVSPEGAAAASVGNPPGQTTTPQSSAPTEPPQGQPQPTDATATAGLSASSGLSLSEMIAALSPAAAACAAASAATAAGGGLGQSALEAAASAAQAASLARSGSGASGELASLQLRQVLEPLKPKWHPPWKLMRVVSGHLGWVTCVDVDSTNAFFATGSNDRLIKIWDLASGSLKLSLTGHVSSLRDLKLSARHPYLFSCAEDGRVKCWDLEQNRVVRDYHGHLSGVYALALHPDLDLLCSGGRDAVVRVWDLRTKQQVYALSGHTGTVMALEMQTAMPHIVSGSQDKMVRLWDLAAGKCQAVLTNHKKSVRAVKLHPTEYSFVTCGADRLKVWRCPLGVFERNIDGHNAIPNCCTIRSEHDRSSLIVGTNNGQLHFWDWASGYKFQTLQSRVQPGSLESENGIFCCCLDKSETRLITGECDKTVKVWKIDEDATEETHPIDWKYTRSFKRF